MAENTDKKPILIVEDDPSILESLTDALEDYFTVSKTSSLAQAWKMMNDGKYPLVIMDLHIPPYLDDHDSGIYLFDKIIRNFPETKIIIISAHANPQQRQLFKDAGSVFIEKPFSFKEILSTLKDYKMV